MAKKKPAARKSKAGYPKGGRPAPDQHKIVPDDYDDMAKLYGTGCTFAQIARKYNVGPNAVANHFKNNIFPRIQASSVRSLESELLKITALERVAWQCFYSKEPYERRELVRSEIAKLKGKTEAQRKTIENLLEQSLTTVHRHHDKSLLDIVEWCIDTRCKLEGHYAAVKVRVQHEEYRVAGKSPAEGMSDLMQRIHTKVQDRRKYEARLEGEGVEFGKLVKPSKN